MLVAHNAPFDMGFLLSGCRASGLDWPPTAVLDTAMLARTVLRGEQVPDCKLATLAAYFRTRIAPCHRALADAQATGEVLLGLLDLVAAARSGRGPAPQPAPGGRAARAAADGRHLRLSPAGQRGGGRRGRGARGRGGCTLLARPGRRFPAS